MRCIQCDRNDLAGWEMASNAVDTCKEHDFENRQRILDEERAEYAKLKAEMMEKRNARPAENNVSSS